VGNTLEQGSAQYGNAQTSRLSADREKCSVVVEIHRQKAAMTKDVQAV
jgi:hypothetical protein